MLARDKRRYGLLAALLLLPLVLTGFCRPLGAQPVDREDVWAQAQVLGKRHNIQPRFIYDIAFAESSFDAGASTLNARGLMQITEPAWERVNTRPFHLAWDWQLNMDASVRYMALLRDELAAVDRFSYAMLAAAYHFGPNKVARLEYDIARLPPTNNRVYQALLAGRQPTDVPLPNSLQPVESSIEQDPIDAPAISETPAPISIPDGAKEPPGAPDPDLPEEANPVPPTDENGGSATPPPPVGSAPVAGPGAGPLP